MTPGAAAAARRLALGAGCAFLASSGWLRMAALELALLLGLAFAAAFLHLHFDELTTLHFVNTFSKLLGVPVTARARAAPEPRGWPTARWSMRTRRRPRPSAPALPLIGLRSPAALRAHPAAHRPPLTARASAGRVRLRLDGLTVEGLTIPNPAIDGVKWDYYAILEIAWLRVATSSLLHTASLLGINCVRLGSRQIPVWIGTGLREIERLDVTTFWLYVDEKARPARDSRPLRARRSC